MDTDSDKIIDTEGNWGKWENHVIIEIQRLNNNLEALREKVVKIDKETNADIRELKIRCGLYGGTAGVIGVAIIEGLSWYFTHR
jgi:hypothetical protein